jgi:CDP-glycerol glycerophosphotransferase
MMIDPNVLELCKDLEVISQKKCKEKRILFFGRDTFCDNSKYLYLHMLEQHKEFEVIWCGKDDKLISMLEENNLPCFHLAKDLKLSCQFLLEAAISVHCINPIDALAGNLPMLACLSGSTSIQLWHGIGIKKVDLAITRLKDVTNLATTKLIRGATFANYYLSPSPFADERWVDFFGAKNILRAGYPRNEVLLRESREQELLGSELDSDSYQSLYHSANKKILLAPTWVENTGLNDPQLLTSMLLFCRQKNISMFVKKHAFINQVIDPDKKIANFHILPSTLDIYPHMSKFDAVITDYSSIIFDYILTEKPILTTDIHKGLDYDYAMLPDGDSFRYIITKENTAEVLNKALFNDDKKHHRQQVKKYLFHTENRQANMDVAQKIVAIFEHDTLMKNKLNII